MRLTNAKGVVAHSRIPSTNAGHLQAVLHSSFSGNIPRGTLGVNNSYGWFFRKIFTIW